MIGGYQKGDWYEPTSYTSHLTPRPRHRRCTEPGRRSLTITRTATEVHRRRVSSPGGRADAEGRTVLEGCDDDLDETSVSGVEALLGQYPVGRDSVRRLLGASLDEELGLVVGLRGSG